CVVAGLDVAEFATTAARVTARAEVDARLTAWTQTQDQYQCARALQAAGVSAAPILHNWQLHSDPHLFAREAFIFIDHPDTGVLPYPGFPWRFSLTRPSVRMAAPRFAEGNEYVFGTLLGCSAEQIASLEDEGVTARVPEMPAPIVI
ncbi:MAG: CoA transferase, partial [Dehalococcoidia bacterium]